jgi:fluoroquinolone resistance protein
LPVCAGASLIDVDLSGAQLHSVKFGGADLRGTDLTALDPFNVELAAAIIRPEQAVVIARALGLEVKA